MSATHTHRVERLSRLERSLLPHTAPDRCPDGARLLALLGEVYGDGNAPARRRALQRDLDELVKTGRIEAVNPGGKPLRYRRVLDDPDEDPAIWHWTLEQLRALAATAVPRRQLDRLWQQLLTNPEEPRLDESRLRVVPDTFRLQPAELEKGVLTAVIQSLIQRRALQVVYVKPSGERTEARLHPQALVQRGPIPYLFALKNDEDEPLRLYALHRMVRATSLTEIPVRVVPDFGQGDLVDLELRVRGYLTEVVRYCPLAADQRQEDEPPESEFELRVWARVPSTGQLLRWLLGRGTMSRSSRRWICAGLLQHKPGRRQRCIAADEVFYARIPVMHRARQTEPCSVSRV
ncbi:WYL domain-containing protein [uncultured Thiocystis sp.]|jgi:predicted DNA-binding transcriptional regulator YafY|uniref:helix-turn-helix transcriptional regulator n=1 Tax=uncultured Thiocystis sp. TaxID=1202134 RepID=UPI0025FF647C|nr:WYL domain-containing protein [uncultured Thiocystis sp.]